MCILVSPNILITLHFPVQGQDTRANAGPCHRCSICKRTQVIKFTFACVYDALSRVRERRHVRILLKKKHSKKTQWEALCYLSNLKKRASVDVYFAGFQEDRTKWANDEWDMNKAFNKFHNS